MRLKSGRRQIAVRGARGFTLVELVVVVAIIAILATIANVSYQEYVVRTRRGAAKACLMEATQFMERFYTTNMRYNTARDGTAVPAPVCAEGANVTNHYAVQFDGAVTASAYRLLAVPYGAQATKDTKCGTLGVDQTGTRTMSGTGTLSECW